MFSRTTLVVVLFIAAVNAATIIHNDIPVDLHPVLHGAFFLESQSFKVIVDPLPYLPGAYGATPAHAILYTANPEVWNATLVAEITNAETEFVVPADSGLVTLLESAGIASGRIHAVIEGGSHSIAAAGLDLDANVATSPRCASTNACIGYTLYLYGSGMKIYISGDTQVTTEMDSFSGVDIALVAMLPPNSMSPEDAAGVVSSFRPAIVVPYRYSNAFVNVNASTANAQTFADLVTDDMISVRLLNWYPQRSGAGMQADTFDFEFDDQGPRVREEASHGSERGAYLGIACGVFVVVMCLYLIVQNANSNSPVPVVYNALK